MGVVRIGIEPEDFPIEKLRLPRVTGGKALVRLTNQGLAVPDQLEDGLQHGILEIRNLVALQIGQQLTGALRGAELALGHRQQIANLAVARVERQGRPQVVGGLLEAASATRRLAQAEFAPGRAGRGRSGRPERRLGAVQVAGGEQRVAEPDARRPVRGTQLQDPFEVPRRRVVSAAAGGEKAEVVGPVGPLGVESSGQLVAAPGLIDVAMGLVEAAELADRVAV